MRRTGVKVEGEEINLGDYPEVDRVLGLARLIMDQYADGTVDQVFLTYTRFVSTIRQEPVIVQLIPVQPPEQQGESTTSTTTSMSRRRAMRWMASSALR